MVSLKLGFVTAAVLASSLLVSAVPVPVWPDDNPTHNGPASHQVEEGSVYKANPANYQPHHPGNTAHGGGTLHPVVAIGRTSPGGHAPVVSFSHNQPPHMQHGAQPATNYDHHTAQAGHGYFQHGSVAAVGAPVHVHHEDLRRPPPHDNLPHQLHHEDTRRLVEDVHHASGYHSTNQHQPYPTHQQQTAAAPWHNHQHTQDHFAQPQHGHQAAAYPAYGHQHQPQHQAYGYGQPAQQHAGYPQHAAHPQHAAPAHHQGPAVYPAGHPWAGHPVHPSYPI